MVEALTGGIELFQRRFEVKKVYTLMIGYF
jgi:hypothetical protein